MVGRAGGGQKLGRFYGKYHCIIGLKAPGNYSAPDWSNKIPILLFEKTKISNFHDFWIFEPVEPRIYSFYYTKILQTNRENMGTSWKHIIFGNLRIKTIENVRTCVYLTF